jgi:hypothetical protein
MSLISAGSISLDNTFKVNICTKNMYMRICGGFDSQKRVGLQITNPRITKRVSLQKATPQITTSLRKALIYTKSLSPQIRGFPFCGTYFWNAQSCVLTKKNDQA